MISLIFYSDITIAIIIISEFTEVKKTMMNGIHTGYTSARNMVTGVEKPITIIQLTAILRLALTRIVFFLGCI